VQLAEQLTQYLQREAASGPFDWGGNNCCQRIARWVAEVEGVDPMADAPPTPTPRAARRLIRHLGGIVQAISSRLQREPLSAAHAALGDVVLYQWADGRRRFLSVGVCNGRTAVLWDERGAQLHINTLACSHAWRIDQARSAAPPAHPPAQTSAPPGAADRAS